ncbi:MAG: ferrous iron transport protein A [Clostridia bacterium]|nr:ferrous iron transport protein A [Clostridia bacterium]
MNNKKTLLCDVPIGKKARVTEIAGGENRRRFLDIGLAAGTVVKPLYKSPSKNPVAYRIRGAVIALRNEDAADVLVKIF